MTLLYIFSLMLFQSVSAQHHHHDQKKDNDSSQTVIFSSEASFGKVILYSSRFPLTIDRKVDFNLSIITNDTLIGLDSLDTKMIIRKTDSKETFSLWFKKNKETNSELSTSFTFISPGLYRFVLHPVLIDSLNQKITSDFEFTQNVSEPDEIQNSHHGFMGMGNMVWIIMGAMMLIMAVLIMSTSGHR